MKMIQGMSSDLSVSLATCTQCSALEEETVLVRRDADGKLDMLIQHAEAELPPLIAGIRSP